MSKLRPIDLLIVEDDDGFREMAVEWMHRKGHHVEGAANGQEALKHCERKHFQVAIFDMNMPGISGLELLQRLKADGVDSEVIFLTGQATVENAVEAMKMGACDYLTKPFPLSELEHRCRMAQERWLLQKENQQLRAVIRRSRPDVKMIGKSRAMLEVLRLVERVGPTDKAVLIQGESGTGKELVARAIHQASERCDKPLVTINCAALPEQLVESELFGHEKGSFTGATDTKNGLFEVADGGTLFIDEIGELPTSLQPKLLRVLEDGSFRRVGSHQERRVDVRILAATNRDLGEEVVEGRFREDLYYRINVMRLDMPPLRERGDDVNELAGLFMAKLSQQLGMPAIDLTEATRAAFRAYDWPGNVRELRNMIERSLILGRVPDIGAPTRAPGSPEGETMEAVERDHILRILDECGGNRSEAARRLGLSRKTIERKLGQWGG